MDHPVGRARLHEPSHALPVLPLRVATLFALSATAATRTLAAKRNAWLVTSQQTTALDLCMYKPDDDVRVSRAQIG
jgi:hypothetical protein